MKEISEKDLRNVSGGSDWTIAVRAATICATCRAVRRENQTCELEGKGSTTRALEDYIRKHGDILDPQDCPYLKRRG